MCHLQDVTSTKERPILLTKYICKSPISTSTKGTRTVTCSNLTHWDAEKTDADLHAGYDVEDFRYASSYDPIIRSVGKSEAEYVLEDEQTGECFDGNFA